MSQFSGEINSHRSAIAVCLPAKKLSAPKRVNFYIYFMFQVRGKL